MFEVKICVDVTVGITDKIPIEEVHMLLVNDLAGGQVDMCCVKIR